MIRKVIEKSNRPLLCTAGTVIVCIMLSGLAHAQQWSSNGNDIYNTNTGKVGIGTSSPTSSFTVVGNGASGWGSADFFRSDLGGWYSHIHYGVTGDWYIRSSLGTGKVILQDTGGNVGIGTTTPPRTLSVVGTMGMSESGNVCCRLMFTTGGSGTVINHNDNSPIFFQTEGTTWLTIKNGTGNVGIGTAAPTAKLDVAGDVVVSGNISAKYQDLAEWVPSSQSPSSGSVVVLTPGQGNSVVRSTTPYDTRVAGVVSANPGIILGEAGEGKVRVATTGRVKVRVDASAGPIEVGDLLVTSSKEGMAMKSQPVSFGGVEMHRPGTLIGKALEPLSEGDGEILVLLSLQ